MSKRKPDVYLQDILESIQQIEEYLDGVIENEFYQNSEKQDAVLRRLEIIGEAVKHISDEIRAVAVAMSNGPEAGLKQIDAILDRGELNDYHLAHSARAELCRKLDRTKEARASWEGALALAQQEPERRFIERKLSELEKQAG